MDLEGRKEEKEDGHFDLRIFFSKSRDRLIKARPTFIRGLLFIKKKEKKKKINFNRLI